eukprot:TRINITY_DN668_c0_g1_i1.p1 TRINITY_DN668_c0_g1~~TRINITY_DN668_c0_g1_i1.p1  ORF type:complete len:405 (-),score=89.73 TRINITY_DN668_c0_g1_i1:66-1280(-)
MEMRGKEFVECFKMLKVLSNLQPDVCPQSKGLRIGVMNVGAPAPGMNPCVRSFLRSCMNQGHTVLRISEGFTGLIQDKILPFNWFDVTGWVVQGGCNIGTSRKLPTHSDLIAIANTIQRHNLQAIVMIGGWDGYASALNMLKQGQKHPDLKIFLDIPIICIPASISNNLPGTDYSVGADTALNNIQCAVDKIKHSAMGTKRAYVIEVMGSFCGYLAVISGMVTGAERIYTHEEGVTLNTLRKDVDTMIQRFKQPSKQVAIVLVNEKASSTYTTRYIQKIYEAEGQDFWEVRESILGHFQQGGQPTPLDRITACRLAFHAANFLHQNRHKILERANGGPSSQGGLALELSVCFGIQEGDIVCSPLVGIEKQIDFAFRRPKEQWWWPLKKDAEILNSNAPSYTAAL